MRVWVRAKLGRRVYKWGGIWAGLVGGFKPQPSWTSSVPYQWQVLCCC